MPRGTLDARYEHGRILVTLRDGVQVLDAATGKPATPIISAGPRRQLITAALLNPDQLALSIRITSALTTDQYGVLIYVFTNPTGEPELRQTPGPYCNLIAGSTAGHIWCLGAPLAATLYGPRPYQELRLVSAKDAWKIPASLVPRQYRGDSPVPLSLTDWTASGPPFLAAFASGLTSAWLPLPNALIQAAPGQASLTIIPAPFQYSGRTLVSVIPTDLNTRLCLLPSKQQDTLNTPYHLYLWTGPTTLTRIPGIEARRGDRLIGAHAGTAALWQRQTMEVTIIKVPDKDRR